MEQEQQIVVGLDVGTTKVCVVVAELNRPPAPPRVLGSGLVKCEGLRKGEVINIDKTVEAVTEAVSQAGIISGVDISEAYVGISGGHINSYNNRATIPVRHPASGVTRQDAERALNAARNFQIPDSSVVLHVIPQDYQVDGRGGVHDPLNMTAQRLGLRVHIITAGARALQDLQRCVKGAGVSIRGFALQPLAASLAVLHEEEMRSGVLLIDIGGGTSDYIVFNDNLPGYSGALAVGGDHLSNDISVGLHLLLSQAEAVKVRHASAALPGPEEDKTCPVPSGPGREEAKVSRLKLHKITSMRMEETLKIIRDQLESEEVLRLAGSGIVLTGGGARLRGIEEAARGVFGIPARLGTPWGLDGLEEIADAPENATAVGLVKYAEIHERGERRSRRLRCPRPLSRILDLLGKSF
ncbi:MAG TPA: cell division protein FtsA [bacterium]|nr:cell division protein FtsA [bacterium]HPQ67333.1 cell division protein FtsA [bacterium]